MTDCNIEIPDFKRKLRFIAMVDRPGLSSIAMDVLLRHKAARFGLQGELAFSLFYIRSPLRDEETAFPFFIYVA